jgi:nitrogen-specific signal transduction histidine kinase
MNTPLTAIRGAVELLRGSWQTMPDAQRQRFLANVNADALRMERLVTRLLQLARIQSAPDAAETVAVRDFFTGLVARYGDRVLRIDASAPAQVVIHPDHLEAAVHNLVVRDYGPRRQPRQPGAHLRPLLHHRTRPRRHRPRPRHRPRRRRNPRRPRRPPVTHRRGGLHPCPVRKKFATDEHR